MPKRYQSLHKVLLGMAASLLSVSAAQPALADPAPAFKSDPAWPLPLPNKWVVGDVGGVAIDRNDHIWIVHRPGTLRPVDVMAGNNPPGAKCCIAAPSVLEFDTQGKLLRSWGGPNHVPDWFTSEHSIFVDAEDNVWIVGAGADDGQLMKFTMDGKLLLRVGRKGKFGAADDPGMLGLPTDIYVDTKRREVYVSDGYRNHRVIVFDSLTGMFKRQWTAYGKKVDPAWFSGPEQTGSRGIRHQPELFTTVHCVTMIGDEVYVCDRTNDRLQVFKPDGTYLRDLPFNHGQAGGAGATWDAAPIPGRPDRIMVLDGIDSEFGVIDTKTGAVETSFLSKGHFPGQMHWPHQIAVDQQGRVYVTEVGGSQRFQRFVPSGVPDRSADANPGKATYITREELDRVAAAIPDGDRGVRVVDIGHETLAVGIVHRGKTVNGRSGTARSNFLAGGTPCGRKADKLPAGGYPMGIIHDAQTEGYYITSGEGTMFTDGYVVNGTRIDMTDLNGPTCFGNAYGVTVKKVKAGDIVIIPAGTVHGWVEVPDHVDYLSFRPTSPGILTPGWVSPALKD